MGKWSSQKAKRPANSCVLSHFLCGPAPPHTAAQRAFPTLAPQVRTGRASRTRMSRTCARPSRLERAGTLIFDLNPPTAAQSVTCGAHARAPFPPPTTHAKGREASTCGSVAPTGAHSAPFASRRTVVPHDAARAGAANIAPGGVIGEVVMKWAVWAERFVKLAPRANNDDKPAGTRLRHSQRAPGSDAIPPSSLEKARVG